MLNKEINEEVKEEKNKNKVSTKKEEANLYIAKLNEDLEAQKLQAEEYCEGLKRNMAEFDNFKKRITKEKESMYTLSMIQVVEKLLPIIDNFETAMEVSTKDEEYKKGIQMIYKELKELLNYYEVEEIPDLGTTFDPEYHEAVLSVQDENAKEKEIVEVFKKGYKIKDKVVRHSLVKVAN